ncbi:transposase [Cucumis melo var. makuwa]|uniref:Transposase n=1 Tax=Cucumis melo var. makuwa TaxID=1194695 RepID=A0A5A7TJY9_CUCMM|nr:transposase [Cucumis melo var. makuwa]
MDKSWMMENRMSREYDIGVESFIQFGLSHAKGYNSIRCPCLKCGNRLLKDVSIVRYHLYASGIDKSYKIWFWHGEDLNSETVTSKMENIGDEKYEHDDLFNTVNMLQSAHDESCNTSNTFDTMFDDAKKPLYPGCKKFTKLSALVRLYNLKVRYGWSNTSFSELLSIISDLLPDNNEIPTSLYEAKKTLGALGLSYQKIDACSNDCCLYRKEYANSTKCPKCGLSRWKINKNSTKENSGVAAKQMWYFSIVPRFIRMFKNLENAKNLCWHAMDRKIDGIMRHPADTPSWRLIDHMWPTFGSEPRNLRLGPKQPGYDINTYLAPLIDDLKILWEEGVRCFDAYKEEYFTLRAVLLWTINDFPAYEHGKPPQPLSGEAIYFKLKEMIFSSGKKCGKNNNEGGNDYWKRRSEFFELPYWKNLHVRHCLDVMHIEKNVCMNIVGTLLDLPGKSKDGMNSRLDLVEMNIRPELAPMVTGNRTYIPAACYTLSREEKYQFCKTLAEIKVLEGYSSNIRSLVSLNDLKLNGLKSHDCHVLMQQLLPIAIRVVRLNGLKEVLLILKCSVVDKEVLLILKCCVVDKRVLWIRSVVDLEVLLILKCVDKGLNKAKGNPMAFYKVLPQSIGAMKPWIRQLVDV